LLSVFVSDLHLSPQRPAATQRFLNFLAGPALAAGELVILGDLFDYWAGDDDLADPFHQTVCAALAALPARKAFLPGNRDFLAGPAFAAAACVELLPDEIVRQVGALPTLLLHGDTLCTDDADYQAFRATVRTPAWRTDFLARPLVERRREIEALRARSEAEKQVKPMAIMDVNAGAVATAFRDHGVRHMIHGHTHRQAVHDLRVGGSPCRRWVLGDWGDRGERANALAVDDSGWRWLDVA
jgi:UDP-2,3-diacylglucosamine hydrolase